MTLEDKKMLAHYRQKEATDSLVFPEFILCRFLYSEHTLVFFLYCYSLHICAHNSKFFSHFYIFIFLAVQNSSIGDHVPCLVCMSAPTNNQTLHNTTEWSWRLVTFETMIKIFIYLHTYSTTYLPTYLSTSLREHPKGVILEPCDLSDIFGPPRPSF